MRSSEFLLLGGRTESHPGCPNVFIARDVPNLFMYANCSEVYVWAEHLSRQCFIQNSCRVLSYSHNKLFICGWASSTAFFFLIPSVFSVFYLCSFKYSVFYLKYVFQDKQLRSRGNVASLWGGGMMAVFCSVLGTAKFWSTSKFSLQMSSLQKCPWRNVTAFQKSWRRLTVQP